MFNTPASGFAEGAGKPGKADKKIQTVDELSLAIKAAIASAPILRNLAVRGEIQNFKRHSSGHVYFTLVGEEARIAAVLFRSNAAQVIAWPQDGDEVLVTGSVDVYPKGGTYQLYATRLMPLGLGAQSRAKEELRIRLEREGLFDVRHKRSLPKYPLRVGVVTSPTGAAIQDILKVSWNRAPFIDIVLIPAVVQGVDAPSQVAAALAQAGRIADVSCVILARGGGARDDLSPFDDERIVRAIRSCPLPVVTGVGHQTDSSLADLAADAALPTPSAAAERVFPDAGEISRILTQSRDWLAGSVLRIGERQENAISRQAERLTRRIEGMLAEATDFIDRAEATLRSDVERRIEHCETTLRGYAAQLDAHSPLAVLSRGYAICKKNDGQIVRSATSLQTGDKVSLQFKDGTTNAKII